MVDEKYYAGLDVGTSYVKAVLVDGDDEIWGTAVSRSGANLASSIGAVFEEVLGPADISEGSVEHVTATGFGRRNASFADSVKTEIICHAKGAYHHFPHAMTLIDIGGQDTKIIKVDEGGKLKNFRMNRKCAAGTGSFLEEIALRLDIPPENMNGLGESSDVEEALGSFCTVFAATEILTKIREGEKIEDMVKSAFESVVRRIIEMDPLEGNVVMSGGVVTYNPVIVRILERHVGNDIFIPPSPQFVGALGAALFAGGTVGRTVGA